jgi:hypothetical protein
MLQLIYAPGGTGGIHVFEDKVIGLEFNDLYLTLKDISESVDKKRKSYSQKRQTIDTLNKILENPSSNTIEKFIKNPKVRNRLILAVLKYDYHLLPNFLVFLEKIFIECNDRSSKAGQFHAYSGTLSVILDVLIIAYSVHLPDALFDMLMHHLGRISYYIGNKWGQSWSAFHNWQRRKNQLAPDLINSMKNYAKFVKSYDLERILNS